MSKEELVAIVTGAGSGIGFAIAKEFLLNNIKVCLNDLNQESLIKAEEKILEEGIERSSFLTVRGDISNEDEVENLFNSTSKSIGECSILVNNAGIVQQKKFHNLSFDDWKKMLSVHLDGCFLCCKQAIPEMLKNKKGIIINIASQLGQIGGIDLAHYSAAKAGIIGFTKSLAREYSNFGIRVNAIAPGPIDTELVMNLSDEWRNEKRQSLPLEKFGKPEDVAKTALFLASDNAKIYVGQTLGPNSGDVML